MKSSLLPFIFMDHAFGIILLNAYFITPLENTFTVTFCCLSCLGRLFRVCVCVCVYTLVCPQEFELIAFV